MEPMRLGMRIDPKLLKPNLVDKTKARFASMIGRKIHNACINWSNIKVYGLKFYVKGHIYFKHPSYVGSPNEEWKGVEDKKIIDIIVHSSTFKVIGIRLEDDSELHFRQLVYYPEDGIGDQIVYGKGK